MLARYGQLPWSRGGGTRKQKSAEGIVGQGEGGEPKRTGTEGLNSECREWDG